MVRYYETVDGKVNQVEGIKPGVWVNMVDPDTEEARMISEMIGADREDILSAQDEEEMSRLELQEGYTLILVDIPTQEVRQDREYYTTIPLGIILTEDLVVTICSEETPILKIFEDGRVRDFSTRKKMRFVYQILYRVAMRYQAALRVIDRQRTDIEERIDEVTEEEDLFTLHQLESNLVYFTTSLRSNANVLDRLTRYKRLQQYHEDQELLDDIIVENQQAIEMATIYRDIINGTRELMSTVIDNRLNNVMKILTSITLVMAIPTIISGLYGMNVNGEGMPLASGVEGFALICVITIVICLITMWILHRKKML